MLSTALRTTFLIVLTAFVSRAATKDAIVIVYAQFPNGQYEIGTGAFVDHDGLVLTADHVVHHIEMSSPSTSTTGSVPASLTPTSVTIYSTLLGTPIKVDTTQQGALVGGQLGSQQWMDIALLRVPLTDAQRLQIQPLDLSQNAPTQGEALQAYGPLCTSLDTRCFQSSEVSTTLTNDPATSRDYEVRANMTLGYSGGPLVNASGNIVAVASWGDLIAGTQITRASYVPSPYVLRYFLSRAPASSILTAADVCTKIHAMVSLTAFDWEELSARWRGSAVILNTADQCKCCCESLDKARNAIGAPSGGESCTPHFALNSDFMP